MRSISLDLSVHLLNRLEGGFFLALVHARTRCFFYHGKNLRGLHVDDFGDSSLHNEKVGVVDVELN
jgi:hypothetical protein